MSEYDDSINKVGLVESALHSNYTRKKTDEITINQLINRLLLLYQKPIIFIFYKKNNENNKFEHIFNTYKDFFFQRYFREEILDLIHEIDDDDRRFFYSPEGYNNSSDESFPEEPKKIGGTNYYYILVGMTRTKEKRGVAHFTAVHKKEYSLIKKLWDVFLNREFSKKLGVEERINICFNRFDSQENRHKKENIDFAKNLHFNKKQNALLNRQLSILSRIIGNIYDKFYESPLLSNKGSDLPNIFFFIRYYDDCKYLGRSTRVVTESKYTYSLRCVIPKQQESDIKKAITLIRNSKRNIKESTWTFDKKRKSEHKEYYKKELADKFWEFLENSTDEKIINIMTSPYGKGAISLVDSPLNQGFVEFRSNIYINGGEERLSSQLVKEGFDSDEVKKYVIFHYVLCVMSPDINSTGDGSGAMITPLLVSSFSLCALFSVISEHESSERWLKNYHFFTGVSGHAVSILRSEAKGAYIKQICVIIMQGFDGLISELEKNKSKKIKVHIDNILKNINNDLTFICRVWPFPRVELLAKKFSGKKLAEHGSIKFLGTASSIEFLCEDNPFFGIDPKKNRDPLMEKELLNEFKSVFHHLEHLIFMAHKKSLSKGVSS